MTNLLYIKSSPYSCKIYKAKGKAKSTKSTRPSLQGQGQRSQGQGQGQGQRSQGQGQGQGQRSQGQGQGRRTFRP